MQPIRCGSDSTSQTLTVYEPPKASAVPTPSLTNETVFCKLPYQITFNNTSTPPSIPANPVTYKWKVKDTIKGGGGWNFVLPSNSASFSPTFNFTEEGTYIVTLVVTNQCGVDSVKFTVNIYGKPIVTLSPITACAGQTLDLSNYTTYTYKYDILTYTWSILPVDGVWNYVNPTNANTDYPQIFYNQTCGIYTAQISITNAHCPYDTATNKITVYSLPIAQITPSNDTTICFGSSIVLKANTGVGLTYQWIKDSVNINGATNSNYTAKVAGDYSCIVSNGHCFMESNKVRIAVSVINVVISANNPAICDNSNTILQGAISNGSGNFSYN